VSSPLVTAVALPLALAFIMFYLGLTLQPADFRALLRRPRALAVGLAGQLLMLPLLGWGVAQGAGLDPAMAVGLMVLVACPGGVSAGLLTHLAAGDVALSIGLTALTSIAAMFTLPLVVDASLQHFMAASLPPGLPSGLPMGLPTDLPTDLPQGDIARMVRSVFALTTLPVLFGMALRAWRPRWVQRITPFAARLSTLLFLLIVLATFWSQRQVLVENLATLGPACLLLNAGVLGGAWVLGAQAGLARRDRIAVATECGLQNSALGIYVCVELLRAPALSVPSVVYALLMNAGAIAFVLLMRRRKGPNAGGSGHAGAGA
jgi:BASS family bile acid:Na+ symporter